MVKRRSVSTRCCIKHDASNGERWCAQTINHEMATLRSRSWCPSARGVLIKPLLRSKRLSRGKEQGYLSRTILSRGWSNATCPKRQLSQGVKATCVHLWYDELMDPSVAIFTHSIKNERPQATTLSSRTFPSLHHISSNSHSSGFLHVDTYWQPIVDGELYSRQRRPSSLWWTPWYRYVGCYLDGCQRRVSHIGIVVGGKL